MFDATGLSDEEVFHEDYQEVFRANTPEKKQLVAAVKRRMSPFAGKIPRTEQEKLIEISELYKAIMELSDFPDRMRKLFQQGAMENGLLRDEHPIDEKYKLLELEINTVADQYFSIKKLNLAYSFALILFVTIRDNKVSTNIEIIRPLINKWYFDKHKNELKLNAIEYNERVAKHFSKAWFDRELGLRIERARRNGW